MDSKINIKQRKADILLIILFLAVPIIIAAASFIMPDQKEAQVENRKLEQYTPITIDNFLSGEWGTAYEKYSLDQTALRDYMLAAYYSMQDVIGRHERNGYFIGDEDYILTIKDYYDEADYEQAKEYGAEQVEAALKIKNAVDSYGGQLVYLNIPPKTDFLTDEYTWLYEDGREYYEITRASIESKMRDAGIFTVSTYDTFMENKDEYIYYKTDNHFTYRGAYYAYQELLTALNQELGRDDLVFPEWEKLNINVKRKRMLGTYLAQYGFSVKNYGDYLETGMPVDMPKFDRWESGEPSDLELIQSGKSAYNAFMSDNRANTVVKTYREELPSILYIGYSFTNALETMSVYSFNEMHSIDPRLYDGNLCDYVRENKIDIVVIVMDDLYESNSKNICQIGE